MSQQQLGKIYSNICKKEVFIHTQTVKESGTQITLQLAGRYIDKKKADLIWHGNDYLVSFNVDYKGKIGIGGFGWAMDIFDVFKTWDSFKGFLNKHMNKFDGYDEEQYGQLCLF